MLLVLAGCPAKGERIAQQAGNAAPDQYDTYAGLIDNLTGAQDELKRLQGLNCAATQAGEPAAQPPYTVSIEASDSGVEIVLDGDMPEENWRLRAWRAAAGQSAFTIISDEPGPAGHSFEANIGDALTINLQLRWLPNGGLRVQRTLLLGGLDHTFELPEAACDWVLRGPWLPYRLLPQPDGPWGVVPNADGQWHSATYPGKCWLPVVCAFNLDRGWLLGVADEHARRLDRCYTPAWNIGQDYQPGELLRLRTSYFDSTKDDYFPGVLLSGLEQRDSVVLQPLAFSTRSADPTAVEAQATQVVEAMSHFVRGQHFMPAPPPHQLTGNIVRLADWLVTGSPEEQARELDRLSAFAGVQYALLSAEEQASGLLTSDLSATLDALGITVIAEAPAGAALQALAESRDPTQAASWLRMLLDSGGASPEAAASDSSSSAKAHAAAPVVLNHCWDFTAGLPGCQAGTAADSPSGNDGGYPVGKALSQAVLLLHAAEGVRTMRPEQLLLVKGYPALCLPAFADGYLSPRSDNGSAGGVNPLAARLANLTAAQVFGANVIAVSPDGSLAGLVLAASGHHAGLFLEKGMAHYPGFEAFSLHTENLDSRGQELRYLYSNPIACQYGLEGERPAQCTKLIGVIPARLESAEAVWVVFSGIGGSVTVDSRNNLYVTWNADGAEQAWTDRLPVGFWKVDHPSPMEIQAGDAVLVRKGSLRPETQPGIGQGI